jgi:acyl-CoA thioesterase
MPEVPVPEDLPDGGPPQIRMHEQYDRRWLWGVSPGQEVPEGQPALCGGWIRLADPRPYDAALIAALTDAWPPAVFQRRVRRTPGGSPTLDLTIHFRAHDRITALAPADWVLARFVTRTARDGFVEEDGELWSRDGVLLAQSRQLAVLR